MDAPVGWGIVGFGWVARAFMAPAILGVGDRVAGVADPSPAAREAALALGLRTHADEAALLADPAVEAVYVATPNHLHRRSVEAAAAAGKAVLCEKPLATTAADARAMRAACVRAGVLHGAAFDQRHHPAHVAIAQAIAAGAIGTPTAIRIVYACWLPADWSPHASHDNWRTDRAQAGGGAAIDLAPHGLDLAHLILGEPVEDLLALLQTRVQPYPVDDGALLSGRTRSGALVQLHVAYNCPDALPRRRLEVLGSKGMIVAENTMGQTPGGSVSLIDADGVSRPLPFDAETSPFEAQARAFAAAVRGDAHDFDGARDLAALERLLAALDLAAPRQLAEAPCP